MHIRMELQNTLILYIIYIEKIKVNRFKYRFKVNTNVNT